MKVGRGGGTLSAARRKFREALHGEGVAPGLESGASDGGAAAPGPPRDVERFPRQGLQMLDHEQDSGGPGGSSEVAGTSRRADEETVTICAWTRQVHYGGAWLSVEEFLERRFGVGITHGISAAAAEAQLLEFRDRESEGR